MPFVKPAPSPDREHPAPNAHAPVQTPQRPAPPPLQLAERGVKIPGLPVEGWVSLADRR